MNYQSPVSKDRKPLHELLPLKQPLSLFIDPSSTCNFRCNFCYHNKIDYSGSVMPLKLFNKIVEDMKCFDEPFKMVHLACFGEPLINGNIVEFVKKLKHEKVAERVQITTNGSLLTRELAEQLCENKVDRILFSIYGVSNEQYEAFSAHNTTKNYFDLIYNNVSYLYSLKDRCEIHCKIAGDFFTEEQKNFFLEKFGAISDTIHIDNAIEQWPGLHVDHKGEFGVYGDTIQNRICPMPFYTLVIHSNGLVSPCPVDWGQNVILGDINSSTLGDIWYGEEYKELRKRILSDRCGTDYCQCCKYPECGATVDITPYKQKLKALYE